MIDPEAGVEISGDAVANFGYAEPNYMGTGEGDAHLQNIYSRTDNTPTSPPGGGPQASQKTRDYAKLGQALMRLQKPQDQQQQGGGDSLTSGFNFNWLAQQEAAGSAEGQKL